MKKRDAYFLAKRQMQDAMEGRILKLKEEYAVLMNSAPSAPDRLTKALELQVRINELEEMRNYVRNVLLWDARNDAKES